MKVLVEKQRRFFNPNNTKDVEDFKYFLKNDKWEKGCPFQVEYPYVSIPDMIKDKIVRNLLQIK